MWLLNVVGFVTRWLGGPGPFQDVIHQWRSNRAGTASLQTCHKWFVCQVPQSLWPLHGLIVVEYSLMYGVKKVLFICCKITFSLGVFQLLVLLLPKTVLPLTDILHLEWWMATAHLQLLLPPILTQPLPSRMDSTPLLLATWATPVQQLLQVQIQWFLIF